MRKLVYMICALLEVSSVPVHQILGATLVPADYAVDLQQVSFCIFTALCTVQSQQNILLLYSKSTVNHGLKVLASPTSAGDM